MIFSFPLFSEIPLNHFKVQGRLENVENYTKQLANIFFKSEYKEKINQDLRDIREECNKYEVLFK